MIFRVLAQLPITPASDLSFVILDDARMATLHEKFSAVPGTTDVLTFDLSENSKPRKGSKATLEGEIYLCLDEARRRAAERDHDVNHELLLYAVHGVLHLLGYDDHTPAEHRRMHAQEDRLLEAVGVGPVYHRLGGRPK